jgi:tetratricopeptide (TPR) repeat protein
MKRASVGIIMYLTLTAAALHAQSLPNQNWLLYEQGNAAAAQKEFGLALQLYKEASLKAGNFPEAEAAIGDIYVEEGEVDLAQIQYEKAYNLRNAFYIPDMQYGVLYKMAHLFEGLGQYKQMEDKLTLIVRDDKRFVETATSRLRTQIEKNFFDKGLDRVLVLYNYLDTFSAPAHSRLGWFYYRTGRYAPSASQLLFSTIYRVSSVEQYLAERDVDFRYSTITDLMTIIGRSPDLLRFAGDVELFRDLYYLAGSTYVLGYPERAAAIWKALAAAPIAGTYQSLSQRQLKSPFTEPLLTVSR